MSIKSIRGYIITILVVVILFTIYKVFTKEEYIENGEDIDLIISNENNNLNIYDENIKVNNKIIIYIAGAVSNEGVYEMEENSRITDCIDMAGGLLADADV